MHSRLRKAIAEVTGAKLTAAGVFLVDPFWGGPDPHFQELEAETREQIESAAKAAGAEPVTRPSSSTAPMAFTTSPRRSEPT